MKVHLYTKLRVLFIALQVLIVIAQEITVNDTGTSPTNAEVTEPPDVVVSTTIGEITFNTVTTTVENLSETTIQKDTQTPADIAEASTNAVTDTTSNLCKENLCKNDGTCIVMDNAVQCICKQGFIGQFCETRDFCADYGDCKNGTCIYSEDMHSRFFKCFSGLYRDEEIHCCREPEPPCFPNNPCKNGAVCNGTSSTEDYTCECTALFTGKNCEIRNNCPMNGICPGGKCGLDTLTNSRNCICPPGSYYSHLLQKCTPNELPCKPNPCNNNGVCEANSPGTSFNCTCDSLFAGKFCDVLNMCTRDGEDVCEHGQCTLLQEEKIQICKCDSTHFFEDGSCEEIVKPCLPNPCGRGICRAESKDGYNCTCFDGYSSGSDPIKCNLRDRCKLDGGETFCNGTDCVMDFEKDMFICNCSETEYFDYSQRICRTLDLCPLMRCKDHQVCRSNQCTCETGYELNATTKECEADFCTIFGCPGQRMSCEESQTSNPMDYKCYCKSGETFDGTTCKPSQCKFPGLNNCKQQCNQEKFGFKCGCFQGYTMLDDNATCEAETNTSILCSNHTCKNGACVEIRGQAKCICNNGYTEQLGECLDLCSAGKLKGVCPEDKCEFTEEGYRCQCAGNYKMANDKTTCAVRKLCSSGEIGHSECSKRNALCNEDFESSIGFKCSCPEGYFETDQYECKKICDLEENQKHCDKLNGVCSSTHTSELVCKCPPPFQSSISGGLCNEFARNSFVVTLPLSAERYANNVKPHRKSSKNLMFESEERLSIHLVETDVTKSMEQLFEDFVQATVLNCKSEDNFILCKIHLLFSETKRKNLDSLFLITSVCKSDESGQFCLLPPSTVIRKDQLETQIVVKLADPCDEDINRGICPSETSCKSLGPDQFTCTCKPGYQTVSKHYILQSSIVENCKDIDECEETSDSSTSVCIPNAHCVNTVGSYDCNCNAGYHYVNDTSKPSKTECKELCNPNPCLHGVCQKVDDGIECRCDAGFTGAHCNFEDKNYKNAKTNTIIVGAVLGGILLITVILFVASVTRLRKRKYSDEPTQVLYSTEMTERHPIRVSVTNTAFEKD